MAWSWSRPSCRMFLAESCQDDMRHELLEGFVLLIFVAIRSFLEVSWHSWQRCHRSLRSSPLILACTTSHRSNSTRYQRTVDSCANLALHDAPIEYALIFIAPTVCWDFTIALVSVLRIFFRNLTAWHIWSRQATWSFCSLNSSCLLNQFIEVLMLQILRVIQYNCRHTDIHIW